MDPPKSHMSMRRSTPVFVIGLLALPTPISWACASVAGERGAVRVADETALIVWDSVTKTEHFIREARFVTNVKKFGFLVPTPTQPTLAGADVGLFSVMRGMTTPRVETRVLTGYHFTADLLDRPLGVAATAGATKGTQHAGSVNVISRSRIGAYDAAVLSATSATGLADWLKENKFSGRPSLVDWLKPYVAKGWYITAFKIASGPHTSGQMLEPVRISFKTDRPFYPYREPDDARRAALNAQGRSLRVYLVTDTQMMGTIGDSTAWPGKTTWSKPLTPENKQSLARTLGAPTKSDTWLTVFDDKSSPRPGTDEVFLAAVDKPVVIEPAPIVNVIDRRVKVPLAISMPLFGLPFLGILLGGGAALRAKRRRATLG
jgi:hypothetical protein